MKPYSLDLRRQAVRAIQAKKSQREVAEIFGISVPTLQRWVRLEKQNALAPRPVPGRQPRVRPEQEPQLKAQVENNPDATLEEHVELWEASQGQHLSRATMVRALIRLGYKRKKRV